MTAPRLRTRQRHHGPPAPWAGRRTRRLARCLLAAFAVAAASACGAQPPPTTPHEGGAEPLAHHVRFGAFTYGGVWQGMEPVLRLESELGRPLDVVHWFMNWDHAYDARMVDAVAAGGRAPLISWQPLRQDVHDIATGRFDDYLRSWARGIRDAPVPVYLRPFPEMNGDWVPWNGDPDALRAAWTRMTALFAAEGAHQVRWVWSPNVTDEPRTDGNRLERYYPGSDQVDVLALSGYNWGEARPAIGWRSFEQVFATGYARLTALGPQPVWLAELASTDVGGDKPAWVRGMFAATAFPRIEALVWFDEDKETDWRLAADPAVLRAFQAGLGVAPLGANLR